MGGGLVDDGGDDDDDDDDGGGKYDVVLHTLPIHPDGEEAEIEEMGCRLWVVGVEYLVQAPRGVMRFIYQV